MFSVNRLTEEPQNNIANVTTHARAHEGEAFLPCSTDLQHSRNNCQLICSSMDYSLKCTLPTHRSRCSTSSNNSSSSSSSSSEIKLLSQVNSFSPKSTLLCLVRKLHMLLTWKTFLPTFLFLLLACLSQLQNPLTEFLSYFMNFMPFDSARTT